MTEPLLLPRATPPYYGSVSRLASIEDLTPEYLRTNYLPGLQFVDELGQPYPDSWYEQKIAVAISNFELNTNLTVSPRVVENETHDYYILDYQMYAFIQLHHYPLILTNATPKMKAVYPTGQLVTEFPREWVRADVNHGQLQLVPTQGSLSQIILGQGGSYLPIIYQGLGYLPNLFWVDYTAGFGTGQLPYIFLDAMAKLACIELLSTIGDAILPAGVTSQSLSIDGMSESRGYQNTPNFAPVFSGRISQYKRELFGDPPMTKGLFNEIKDYYRGINMMVVA